MVAIVVRRLLWLPVVLFFVSVITFLLGFYAPGDPVQVLLGVHATPDTIERLRHEYGFDKPIFIDPDAFGLAARELSQGKLPLNAIQQFFDTQYFRYIANALHGNFGYSLVKYRDQPVGELIAERLPITLQLNFIALVIGVSLGLPLGILTGLKRNTRFDFTVRTFTLVSISISLLALLPILTFIFSRRQDIFGIQAGPILPMVGGRLSTISGTDFNDCFGGLAPTLIGWGVQPENIPDTRIICLNQLPKLVLPILIESLGYIAIMTRQMRASLIEVLGQDYVRTARAKGLRERSVLVRHAMRNALLPIATILGLSLGGLVEGSFLVESWFGIPGVGALAVDALYAREYYIIVALVLIIAVAYVVALLALDLIRPFLDPRLRQVE